MGREALKLAGHELHHFVLAAACFLAAHVNLHKEEQATETDGEEDRERITASKVKAALEAAIKAHKRFVGTFYSTRVKIKNLNFKFLKKYLSFYLYNYL